MEAKNNNKNGMNVIENIENEVQVTEESRKAYGRPSINEEKGWKLQENSFWRSRKVSRLKTAAIMIRSKV